MVLQVHTKHENKENVETNKIPPYQTSFGSIATTDNAIRLIYRYILHSHTLISV